MITTEKCGCEQSSELIQDIHIIAKSIQILAGREQITLWEDLEPAWDILKKHGYSFKEYPLNYDQKPEKWHKTIK